MLTGQQWALLRAVMDLIIPPDDFLGATEAGVETYLRQQFDGDLRSLMALYRSALDALDQEARAAMGVGFAALPPEAQDKVLRRIESGTVETAWPIDPARFFSTLVGHVMEGYYADPGNGGNRDGLAWKMVGFEVTA